MATSQKPSFLDRLKAFFKNPFNRPSSEASTSGSTRKGGIYNSTKHRNARGDAGASSSGGGGARSFGRPTEPAAKRSDRAKAKSRKVKPKA